MPPLLCKLIIVTFTITCPYLYSIESYQIDTKPLFKYPAQAKKFQDLHEKFQKVALTIEEHKERIEILDFVLGFEPDWSDGYWLLGSESFILASFYPSENDYDKALAVLNHGLNRIKTCLEKSPEHLLCRFFQGTLLAKIASIEGIFASLKHGRTIHDAFYTVTQSNINMQFRPNVSLLGSAYYGLGLFYRLVPDLFLIDWIWGIRGNLKKSIALHKKSVSFDDHNPCALLMLSVALLCKYNDDESHPERLSAFEILAKIQTIPPTDKPQESCINESYKIQENPHRTCGYTQAKYQEKVEN